MWKLMIVIVLIVAGVLVARQLLAGETESGDSYYGMPEQSETES
jgi:hypothetical protein